VKSPYVGPSVSNILVPGSLDKKWGKPVPSFIKQRWNIDRIFLPPVLSNEPCKGLLPVQWSRFVYELKLSRYSTFKSLVYRDISSSGHCRVFYEILAKFLIQIFIKLCTEILLLFEKKFHHYILAKMFYEFVKKCRHNLANFKKVFLRNFLKSKFVYRKC
jgi:hypothetical protein